MAIFGGICEGIAEAGKLQQSSFAQNYALGQAQQNALDWQRAANRNEARADAAEAEAERLRRDFNSLRDKYISLAKLAEDKGIIRINR